MAHLTRKPEGLDAFNNISFASWEDLTKATGLTYRTMKKYLFQGLMPKPEPDIKDGRGRNVWDVERQDVKDWVTRKSRPGRGYRTDMYGPMKRPKLFPPIKDPFDD
jgi:hypothetical protein